MILVASVAKIQFFRSEIDLFLTYLLPYEQACWWEGYTVGCAGKFGFKSAPDIRARAVPPSIPRPRPMPRGSSRRRGGRQRRTPRARWSQAAAARAAPSRCARNSSAAIRSRPVRTNPLASRSTLGGSQSLRGRVPMNTNSASTSSTWHDPSSRELSVDPFYVAVALDSFDFRPGPQPDVRRLLDLIDEVLRHGVAQAIAADHDLHFFRVARQIHGALARRVSAADDEYAPAGTLRLRWSRRRSTRPRPCAPLTPGAGCSR